MEDLSNESWSLGLRRRCSLRGSLVVMQREQAKDQERIQGQTGPGLAQGLSNKKTILFLAFKTLGKDSLDIN